MIQKIVNENTLWTKGFISLLAVNLLLCLGFYMLPPTLPAYVKEIGGSNFQASLVIGMFSIMSLISRVISGSIVDARGEKTVIFFGLIAIVVTTISFIWLPVSGILLSRTLQGIGWGMATAAIATAVFKIVPETRRGEGSGYYALTTIISLSLTPIIAILVLTKLNFTVVAIVSGILTCASILMLGNSLSALSHMNNASGKCREISLKNVFEKGALLPSILCFILSVPLCGIMSYLVLFGKELQMDNIWVYFIGYALMILITRPYIGRLFDRKGHLVIILPGSLLMILGLTVLSFTQSTAMLILSSMLYGLGYGAVQPSLQTWAVNRCPEDRKAAANGLFLSSIDLGYIVGAVALGYIAEITNYASMYRYSAIFMVVFVVIYVVAWAESHSSIAAPATNKGGK